MTDTQIALLCWSINVLALSTYYRGNVREVVAFVVNEIRNRR